MKASEFGTLANVMTRFPWRSLSYRKDSTVSAKGFNRHMVKSYAVKDTLKKKITNKVYYHPLQILKEKYKKITTSNK